MASADAGTRDTQDDSRTMRERMEAGELYVAADPELVALRKRARRGSQKAQAVADRVTSKSPRKQES